MSGTTSSDLEHAKRDSDPAAAGAHPPADVGILIALEEEFEQFKALLDAKCHPERDHEHGGYDYIVELGRGRPYRCVVRLLGDMGPQPAELATERLIRRWQPALLVNIGIAAGIHQDVHLGDVVIAEQTDAYAATAKAVPAGEDQWTFEHRGRVYHGDHAILEEVRHFRFVHDEIYAAWRQAGKQDIGRLASELQDSGQREELAAMLRLEGPDLHRAHLASGPVVGASRSFADWLRRRDQTIKALDMEAAGFVEAAIRRRNPTMTLVIRGISDRGDEHKSSIDAVARGAVRRIAMGNATRMLLALIDAKVLPRASRSGAAGTGAPANTEGEQEPSSSHLARIQRVVESWMSGLPPSLACVQAALFPVEPLLSGIDTVQRLRDVAQRGGLPSSEDLFDAVYSQWESCGSRPDVRAAYPLFQESSADVAPRLLDLARRMRFQIGVDGAAPEPRFDEAMDPHYVSMLSRCRADGYAVTSLHLLRVCLGELTDCYAGDPCIGSGRIRLLIANVDRGIEKVHQASDGYVRTSSFTVTLHEARYRAIATESAGVSAADLLRALLKYPTANMTRVLEVSEFDMMMLGRPVQEASPAITVW